MDLASRDTFLQSVPEILRALPDDPVAVFSMVMIGIFLVAIIFFRNGHPALQFASFSMLLVSCAGVGYAAYELYTPKTVSTTSLDDNPARLPASARFGFLPADTNILIFDASSSGNAASGFAESIIAESMIREVAVLDTWRGKFVMDHSRIYYVGAENEKLSQDISTMLLGRQFVIDYLNQEDFSSAQYWPDLSHGFCCMFGFNVDRDIVIFAGNDIPTQ